MRSRSSFILLIVVVAAALLAPTVLAGQPPAIYSVSEGKDPGTGQPTLSITGKGLTQFVAFHLIEAGTSISHGAPDILSRKATLLVLRLPADLAPGAYVLTVADKKGTGVDLAVSIANGKPLPGSVEAGALGAGLKTDLDDAESLDGHPGTYYLDAGNMSGTLSTGAFSAFGDLLAEGKVGTGATQVAPGDHKHAGEDVTTGTISTDRYSALADLSAESKIGTGSTQVAAGDHNHDGTYVKPTELASYATKTELGAYAKKSMVGARSRRSGQISPTTQTIIPFNSEEYDTDGFYDPATPERLTVPVAGFYLVQTMLSVQMAADFTLEMFMNGSKVAGERFTWGAQRPGTVTLTRVLKLAKDDYLEVRAARGDSNNFVVYGNGDDDAASWFSVYLLGE